MDVVITIYSGPICEYSYLAKLTLDARKIPYVEIPLFENPEGEQRLKEHGCKTIPQFFYGAKNIGGYDDFVEWLDQRDQSVISKIRLNLTRYRKKFGI